MRYASIRKYDVSNWEGINATIFFSGCNFHCPGCFNKVAQDFNYGDIFDKSVMDAFINMAKDEKIDNVCMLGGEVFQQDLEIIYEFVSRIKEEVNKPIIVWTGYLIEDLLVKKDAFRILEKIDYLIDGQFILGKKDLSLKFRGSSNQRVIDVNRTIFENKVVTFV